MNDAANDSKSISVGSHQADATFAAQESSLTKSHSASVPQTTTAGIFLVIVAAVLWSSNGFFTQTTLLDGWPRETRGAALVFWRACFALVLLLPLVRRPTWHRIMIPMTICFVVMNWTYLTAIVNGSPANTIWLQNLAPAWVMIGAVLFFHERAALRDWAMMVTCVMGVLFILVMEFFYVSPSPQHRWWSPVLAIASGLSYAGVIVCVKALRHHESAWLIALNHMATAIIMLPIVWWSGVSFPSGSMWFLLAGIGMLQMGLPYLLFARGLRTTPSHLASLITLLEPVLLPVWVHLTRLNDPTYVPPHWWTWVGAGFILIGLTIRYAWPTGKTTAAGEEPS
ncbi:MAG: DMT family transporter [Planctomycetota bacterium]|nr:DMT family transporter [Planctomycetota bacterium]